MKRPRERTNWEKQLPLVNSVRRLRAAEMITNEQAQGLYKAIQDKYPIDPIDPIAAILR